MEPGFQYYRGMNKPVQSAGLHGLTVVINGDSILEYDRDKGLPAQQSAYLDRMDRQMDTGLTLNGEVIASPDQLQRAQFVALHLIEALRDENEAQAAASCAYLANRIPELKQVRVEDTGAGLHVDLVFDRAYSREVRVGLSMPPDAGQH